MRTARELGIAGAADGASVIEIARMHEAALMAAARGKDGRLTRETVKRAQKFFLAVLKPMEARATQARAEASSPEQREQRVKNSKAALADSEKNAQRQTGLRRSSEEALRQKRLRFERALNETDALEGDLRRLARRTMAAMERERGEFSRLLQDEVAQSLIGIKLRLAHLEEKRSDEAEKMLSDISVARSAVKKTASIMEAAIKEMGGGN